MLNLGALAFAAPWLLAALLVLPVLWWLLRVTPPSPRLMAFPAIRLLRDLAVREETPARTPLWLLILRILIAALVILGLSRPLLNPDALLPGTGPLLLVVDNGWAAGRDWRGRRDHMERLVDQAERQDREVVLLATAPSAAGERPRLQGPMAAGDARREVQALEPMPWATDRRAALAALEAFSPRGTTHAVWLADGLGDDAARGLADRLQRLGGLTLVDDGEGRPAMMVRPPVADGGALVVPVERADARLPLPVAVRAAGPAGRLLGRVEGGFEAGQARTELRLELPTELRNEMETVQLDGQATAGAVHLVDERWRRRPVGLVSGRPEGENQPLLSELYYIDRALGPYAEIRQGGIEELLKRQLAVLILADVGTLSPAESDRLSRWVEEGGVLLRFAGPRLAQNADTLIPVRLRSGDRALGGALSWSEPARLAPFEETSPFHGLALPEDVTVTRQVLAEPGVDLAEKTWMRLEDGTPLVTAERRGGGWVVLVHTTAGPDWSNLSLSGLYVEMLRRVVALSQGVSGAVQAGTLPPLLLLDGQGRLAPAPATAFPLPAEALAAPGGPPLGPRHPPGYYGTEEARRAVNLSSAVPALAPLEGLPASVALERYGGRSEIDLKPWLLGLALPLAILDLFVGLALRGLLPLPRLPRLAGRGTAAAVLLGLGLALVPAAGLRAQDTAIASPASPAADEETAIKATADTYLAFVRTGDLAADAASEAGLAGLSEELNRRTAVETAGVMGVDLEQDELSFFPLLYWPVTGAQGELSEAARLKVNEYLRNGGTILLDTRDQDLGAAQGMVGGGARLEAMLRGLDIPPLAPVPPDHVLTKAFYLLQDFPGRYSGGQLWVEAQEGRANDGVSSVVIGGNDWAGAWAVDRRGRPLNAMVPGGERQREMAYRFGINLVMYALTGNYKADQVHVPAILERLGQ